MRIKVPYLVSRPGANGTTRWFWQPSSELRKLGWRNMRLQATTLDEAVELAKARNKELEKWRKGETLPSAPGEDGDKPPLPVVPEDVRPGSLSHIIRLYKASPTYSRLAAKTRKEYDRNMGLIEEWAGKAPVKAITPLIVQEYYSALWATGKQASANATIRVLRLLLGFARRNEFVTQNAAEKPGLATLPPRLRVYSDQEISAIVAAADQIGHPSIGDAVVYGCYLGQRQGDLLGMKLIRWQYDNSGQLRVRLRQRKTDVWINVPAHPMVAARFQAAEKRRREQDVKAPTVIWHEGTLGPWSADTFRHVFAEARTLAAQWVPTLSPAEAVGPLLRETMDAIAEDSTPVWFMDTRDTAVTKLAEASCTVPEICSITGHDEDSAYKILKHYMALNGGIADTAIAKLVAHEERKRTKEAASS